jgi:hypothetical protein
MTKGFLGATMLLAISAGLTFGQPAGSNLPAQPVPVVVDPAPSTVPAPSSPPEVHGVVEPVTCDAAMLWADAEYLLWWIKDGPLPAPLATLGGTVGPGPFTNTPGTIVVLGHQDMDYGTFSGIRARLGAWLVTDHSLGVEAGGFLLERNGFQEGVRSDVNGNPTLTRPFVDAVTGMASAILISAPGLQSGDLRVASHSRLWGAEVNLRTNVAHQEGLEVDLLGGFRYLGLDEGLTVMQDGTVIAGGPPFATFTLRDRFYTRSQFYGGQLGAEATYHLGKLSLGLSGKLALGGTEQAISVSEGGLLVLPSNFGHHSHADFSVVPQVGLQAGYQVTPHMRVFLGYDFLYWSSVARPGDQIDTTINVSQAFGPLIGPARPVVPFHTSDFWAQGLNLGLEVRF